MNASPIIFASQLARLEATSALPQAPVVGGRGTSPAVPVRLVRSTTARVLRFAADRVAPQTYPTCA